MWQEKFKNFIIFGGRVITALILIAVLFPILFSTLMHFEVANFFESPGFGGWNITIRLFITSVIPFLSCVVLAIGLVLRFFGGGFRTAIFTGTVAGLLHFIVAGVSTVTKSTNVFVKMGVLQLLLIPLAALVGAFAYFIVSKLNSKKLKSV